MNYREYADHIDADAASVNVEEDFYVAPTEHWELADFEDIVAAD